ncbi:MAG: 50S ribosomal protein L21 [Pseudomonadota bacterium]
MFAVLRTGGKQYKVASGDTLTIEKIAGNTGETVQFNEVLMLGGDAPILGAPLVQDAGVQAEILEQGKGPKTIKYVKRRRKHSSQRRRGHRQQLTTVRITDILTKGALKSGVAAALGGAGFVPAAAEEAAPNSKTTKKKAAPKTEAPKKEAAPKKAVAKKNEAAPASGEAVKPANLLDAARDGKADDLKKISGVGPKLEEKLHANGIFHYDQIAAWSEAEIAYVDDQLSFKGRIERDDWIGQATELMKG